MSADPYAISPKGLRLFIEGGPVEGTTTYEVWRRVGTLDVILTYSSATSRDEAIASGLGVLRDVDRKERGSEDAFRFLASYKNAHAKAHRKGGSASKRFFEDVSRLRAKSDTEALKFCKQVIGLTETKEPKPLKLDVVTPPSQPLAVSTAPFTFARTPCGTFSSAWTGRGNNLVGVWDLDAHEILANLELSTDALRSIAGNMVKMSSHRGGGFNDNPYYTDALATCDDQWEREYLIWEVCKALAFGEVWAEEVCKGHLAFKREAKVGGATRYARTPKSIRMEVAWTSQTRALLIDDKNVCTWSDGGIGPALYNGWGKLWGAEVRAKGGTQLTANRAYQDLETRFRTMTQLPRDLITASGGELTVPVSFKALSLRRAHGDDAHVLAFMDAVTKGKSLPAYPAPLGDRLGASPPAPEPPAPSPPPDYAKMVRMLEAVRDKAPKLWTPELAKQLAEARAMRIAPLPGAEWMQAKGPLHGKIPNLK
jgi:hypothetical protein